MAYMFIYLYKISILLSTYYLNEERAVNFAYVYNIYDEINIFFNNHNNIWSRYIILSLEKIL